MYQHAAKKSATKTVKVKLQSRGSVPTQFGEGSISPQVKLGAKRVKAQFGEGSISPQVKLGATKRVKAQFGEGTISPQIKLAASRLETK